MRAGEPATDITVSPKHRFLVRVQGAEALVAAEALVNGTTIVRDPTPVKLIHVLFDSHELQDSYHKKATISG